MNGRSLDVVDLGVVVVEPIVATGSLGLTRNRFGVLPNRLLGASVVLRATDEPGTSYSYSTTSYSSSLEKEAGSVGFTVVGEAERVGAMLGAVPRDRPPNRLLD
jgi:hypothetical protein